MYKKFRGFYSVFLLKLAISPFCPCCVLIMKASAYLPQEERVAAVSGLVDVFTFVWVPLIFIPPAPATALGA